MSELKEIHKSTSDPTTKTERHKIIIIATHSIPLYERPINSKISEEVIAQESLPAEMPLLGSSIIEDFIRIKVQDGVVLPDQISEAFVDEDIPKQVTQYLDQVRDYSRSLNWENIFTPDEAKRVQANVCQEMASLGISSEKISEIANMDIAVTDSPGISFPTNEGISVSQLQIIRNALDYMHVYGNSVPIEQVISTYIKSTVGHELGHKIDYVLNNISNTIPLDKAWGENNYERPSERFAEYWGRLGSIEDQQIVQKIVVMHLAKVDQLWSSLNSYNQTHENKIDLSGVFRSIRSRIERNSNVMSLFDARLHLYSGNIAENYALPYPRETIILAIKSKGQ